ncbi:hypothetical protein [Actinomadura roseirufa]|uniref:hypothetical protein n=1 Tax=Actinomadura roseirufa TaxID=2094049 RepID=UPI0010414F8A|nr:hypothetical protein [Actinomadura roseirufa]
MDDDAATAREMVEVRLVGGPADWAGRTLQVPRSQVYGCRREQVGASLVSAYTPPRDSGEGPDVRALYEPDRDEAADVATWRFRGWSPRAVPGLLPADAERRALARRRMIAVGREFRDRARRTRESGVRESEVGGSGDGEIGNGRGEA